MGGTGGHRVIFRSATGNAILSKNKKMGGWGGEGKKKKKKKKNGESRGDEKPIFIIFPINF